MASCSRQIQDHDRTIKVTILASEWGSSKGGLSTINRELAIQLAKLPNVEVTFFLPKCSHESRKEAQHHGISLVEVEGRPGYEELDWLSLQPEHLEIDVVVVHDSSGRLKTLFQEGAERRGTATEDRTVTVLLGSPGKDQDIQVTIKRKRKKCSNQDKADSPDKDQDIQGGIKGKRKKCSDQYKAVSGIAAVSPASSPLKDKSWTLSGEEDRGRISRNQEDNPASRDTENYEGLPLERVRTDSKGDTRVPFTFDLAGPLSILSSTSSNSSDSWVSNSAEGVQMPCLRGGSSGSCKEAEPTEMLQATGSGFSDGITSGKTSLNTGSFDEGIPHKAHFSDSEDNVTDGGGNNETTVDDMQGTSVESCNGTSSSRSGPRASSEGSREPDAANSSYRSCESIHMQRTVGPPLLPSPSLVSNGLAKDFFAQHSQDKAIWESPERWRETSLVRGLSSASEADSESPYFGAMLSPDDFATSDHSLTGEQEPSRDYLLDQNFRGSRLSLQQINTPISPNGPIPYGSTCSDFAGGILPGNSLYCAQRNALGTNNNSPAASEQGTAEPEQLMSELQRKEQLITKKGEKRWEQEDSEWQEAEPSQQEDVSTGSQRLCEHYLRLCRVQFPCCTEFYSCHKCHNKSTNCENSEAKACDATRMKCSLCRFEQEIDQSSDVCHGCGEKMAAYFCFICKQFKSSNKNPYHCDQCGICRHYKDEKFHCEVCGVCMVKRLQNNHKCRPDSGHDQCFICLEDTFGGCLILPCSHRVHLDCARAMKENGIRDCPTCRHPLDFWMNERPTRRLLRKHRH